MKLTRIDYLTVGSLKLHPFWESWLHRDISDGLTMSCTFSASPGMVWDTHPFLSLRPGVRLSWTPHTDEKPGGYHPYRCISLQLSCTLSVNCLADGATLFALSASDSFLFYVPQVTVYAWSARERCHNPVCLAVFVFLISERFSSAVLQYFAVL